MSLQRVPPQHAAILRGVIPRLLIEDAQGRKSVFELDMKELVMGRAADAGLVLEDGRASRRHACITRHSGVSAICDLNSGNGLYVNGQRVSEKVLANGDVIQIGRSRLVVEDGAHPSQVQFAEHDTAQDAMLVRRIEDAASPVSSPAASAADIAGGKGNWTDCGGKLEFSHSCTSWARLSKGRSCLMRFIFRLAHLWVIKT